MKWLALLLVVAGAIAAPSLLSQREKGCEGRYAFSPGPSYDSAYQGEETAELAADPLIEGQVTTTREERTVDGRAVVTFRAYDEDDRLIKRVEIEQRESGGWYEGESQVCS